MLIEIQCSNSSDFDPATGFNKVCGHRFMVDSADIGQLIDCPQCQQQVEVSQPPNVESGGNTPAPTRRTASQRSAKTATSSRADVMDVDFADQQLESTFSGQQGTRCKKCGKPAPYGRCGSCRYVEPRFAKMHMPLDKIKMKPSGMQLWFMKTLSDGMSIKMLSLLAHVSVGILALGLLFLSILQLTAGNYVFGGILLVGTLSLVGFYFGLIFKGYQFVKNPRAKLAWFQKPFWLLMLYLARSGKWENYDARLKNRRVIKVTEPGFTDHELNSLPGIRNVQVLDLENTQVTDQGVALLYRLEHLECLVLRKTNVTHEAVVRLQQTFPKLWIWY